VAAADYVRAYPELIAAHVRARFVALGTDGFGRSDTRAALRIFLKWIESTLPLPPSRHWLRTGIWIGRF
jgi:pyruvate dehydrogenase complex dehydrogenase (E1) component